MKTTTTATMAPMIAGDNPDLALDVVTPVVSDPVLFDPTVDVAESVDVTRLCKLPSDGEMANVGVFVGRELNELARNGDGTGGGVGTVKSRATWVKSLTAGLAGIYIILIKVVTIRIESRVNS